jgi:hypothetical protein
MLQLQAGVKQLKHQLDLTAANAFGSRGNFKIMKFRFFAA